MNHSDLSSAEHATHQAAAHARSGQRHHHSRKEKTCLPTTNAVINVHNLRLRTYIGFNPDEKVKQQDVIINIEIEYALNPGTLDDIVEDALDYKLITKRVIRHVENGQFLLLEKLVADVLAICSDDADTKRARVRIDKPHALRFADSVSLTLEYRADDPDSHLEKRR
jgi:D-erythro-7,8-dihydroneopterin triphosphate epimerase